MSLKQASESDAVESARFVFGPHGVKTSLCVPYVSLVV